MMIGYIFPIQDEIFRERFIPWKYIIDHRSEWREFDYEIGSIDMGLICEPRFIIDGKVYNPYKQYFIQEGETVIRLLVLIPGNSSEYVNTYDKVTESVPPPIVVPPVEDPDQ